MKELSIEEKAKAYDKALEKARKLYNSEETSADVEIACENIFPELKESEEEKIRKELIHYFTEGIEFLSLCSVSREQILAWLEKHGEPMEINPNEFDTRLQALIGKFDSLPKEELIGSLSFWMNVVQNDGTYKPDEEKQNEQKHAWSEEDEEIIECLNNCLDKLEEENGWRYVYVNNKIRNWLKSLSPQNRWEPSDGQMDSITCAVRKMKESACYDSELVSLFNDLKKLKG